MPREALDKFKCLLSKSWSAFHAIRRLSVEFYTNILTSKTHLQRVEGTQALEGIRSNLRDLVVAEVSVNGGESRVMKKTELRRMRKKRITDSDKRSNPVSPFPSTIGTSVTRDCLHSVWSVFCWQGKGHFLGTQSAPIYVAAHRELSMGWLAIQLPRAWFLAGSACLPNGRVMRWDITKAQGFSLILEHSLTNSTGSWPFVKTTVVILCVVSFLDEAGLPSIF